MNFCQRLLFSIGLITFSFNAFADKNVLILGDGQLLAKTPDVVHFFAKNPQSNFIYASTSHSILMIDPVTKTVKKMPAWGEPRGLTVSPDGKKLYVAKSSAQEIMVVDTETFTELDSIPLPYPAYDLKHAHEHFLIATSGGSSETAMQIDVQKGSVELLRDQFNSSLNFYNSSVIEMSPDKKTFYVGNRGLSPASLSKYELSHHHHFILMSLDQNKSYEQSDLITKLKPIVLSNNGYPVLVKQGETLHIFYKSSYSWSLSKVNASLFKTISFPAPDQTSILNENEVTDKMRQEVTSVTKIQFKKEAPYLIYKNEHGSLGSNGQSLHLTAKGNYIYFAVGGGNNGYNIARIRTKDMALQGALNTGPYPRQITTSPDEKIAYTYSDGSSIKVWNTETQKQLCEYNVGKHLDYSSYYDFRALTVDHSDDVLFIATSKGLLMFKTGCEGEDD